MNHMSDGTPAAVPSCIAICGKARIATAALSYSVHYVAAHGLPSRIVACPNADDKGYDTWADSLRRAAALLGVPVASTDDLEGIADLLLVSLEYDRIVRIDRFKSRRLYNVHFSALPAYRGVLTSVWPILNGESEVGVSLHVMDAGVDTGPVIDRRVIQVRPHATARQIYDHYLDEGLNLFREWMPRLVVSSPCAAPQDEGRASSYDRKSLDLRQREVPLHQRADLVCRFVRAITFPEFQRPTVKGRAVQSCAPFPAVTDAAPGTALHETAFSTTYAVGGGEVIEIIWA